jgi:hypothetical protein
MDKKSNSRQKPRASGDIIRLRDSGFRVTDKYQLGLGAVQAGRNSGSVAARGGSQLRIGCDTKRVSTYISQT